jgi:hypothetical protein
VQGAYRLFDPGEELIEEFVAAPGPIGWRYFAHVHPPEDPDHDRFTVDLVTDLEWNLVRFRLVAADGWRAVATRSDSGVEVLHGTQEDEQLDRFDEAVAVWSSSPSTLLVLDRRFGPNGGTAQAVTIEPGAPPTLQHVALSIMASTHVATPGGDAEAQRVGIVVDGRRREALIRSDLPLAAEGWFDLIA